METSTHSLINHFTRAYALHKSSNDAIGKTENSPDKSKPFVEKNQDSVSISPLGKSLAASQSGKQAPEQLDRQEILQLQELKQRDAEVRAHEQAHLSVAGPYARGGASYTYQKGPDGTAYAIGGEVGIDVGKEPTPEATISKMQTIKRAALAPANPSAADRSIASRAEILESQARQGLLLQRQEELHNHDNATKSSAELTPHSETKENTRISSTIAYNTFQMKTAYQQTASY